MSDDEDFAFYGTPLDPIEEDAVPSKKPTPIEEQVVLDKQGRRRFHGAFTGGFSAGYFNSVGSEEGWTPSTFKSSRSEKASQRSQKPEDFMDDEDQGEFGIAPKVLRATSDYNDHSQSSSRKRTRVNYTVGPIPGQPVLRDILKPVKDTVGVRLLRSMGWRPGQGVGPRLSHDQKKIQRKEIRKASTKVYGCQMPGDGNDQIPSGEDSSEESDTDTKSVTYAPDDYAAFVVKVKDDVIGIGYEGLDRRPVLSGHVQLFEPSFLGMQEKKKKVAIWGQAFGVGALEEDDEDIYARDDMSQYNFELESSEPQNKGDRKSRQRGHPALTGPRGIGAPLEGFILGKNQPNSQRKYFRPPELPPGFNATHETKQSRWDVNSKGENVAKKQGLGRHDIDARVRASILDEPLPKPSKSTPVEAVPSAPQAPSTASTSTVAISPAAIPPVAIPVPLFGSASFRPFLSQPDKQVRYEKFLDLVKNGQKDLLPTIQPSSMTDWDKEHERSEFEQAARLYKSGVMIDRFVSASQPDDSLNPLAPVEKMKNASEEMCNAAKMKMFGKLTRTRGGWQPCALLCKRFNVPQPSSVPDVEKPSQRSSSGSVFAFLEASTHNAPVAAVTLVSPKQEELVTDADDSSAVIQEPTKPIEEHHDQESIAVKSVGSITDTLARLLADDTGKVQPEPEEKPDLFKAIFLSSSSESDSEDEETPNNELTLLPEKKASEINIPRNLSPPRGIFANLDLDALNARPTEKKEESPNPEDDVSNSIDRDLMYGPRLPSAVPKTNAPSSSATLPLLQSEPVSAMWVERKQKSGSARGDYSSESDDSSDTSDERKKSSKKKKKHSKHSKQKKEKKHKKHKSKHKRKS